LTFVAKLPHAGVLPGRILALGACAASITALAGCAMPEPAAEARPPQVRLEGVQFRAWRGEALAASGTAREATYLRGSGEIDARDVEATLPRPGAPDLALRAPVLAGDLRARTWSASGGVTLRRGDATARTASARWSAEDGLVRGDEPVEIAGPRWRLAGPGFTADPETGNVEMKGGVRLVAGGLP
jgi:hypothetical protein